MMQNEDFDMIEEEQQKLNEVCQLLKRKPLQLYSLTSYDHVRRQLGDTIEHITDEMIQMRRRMHIAQVRLQKSRYGSYKIFARQHHSQLLKIDQHHRNFQ